MKRQAIDDGGWIDLDAAEAFDEATRWDGSNHISLATGSQWEHERLFCSARGVYVLHRWSQWQGSGETWERIGEDQAAEWLVINSHSAPSALEQAMAALEV